MKKVYSLGYLRTSFWTKISEHKNKTSKIEFIFSRHYTNRDFIERIESIIIFTKYQELVEEWMKELIIFEILFHLIINKSRRFSNCRSQTRETAVPFFAFGFPKSQDSRIHSFLESSIETKKRCTVHNTNVPRAPAVLLLARSTKWQKRTATYEPIFFIQN